MEFDWMEDLLAEGHNLLLMVFEQGLLSAGTQADEASKLAGRFQEAGLVFGGNQFSRLAEELRKSRLKKNWQPAGAVEVYRLLWRYIRHCRRGLELARVEMEMEV